MRWFLFVLASVCVMANVSYAQVTLSYTENSDPASGFKSYTVHATGTGINVLGSFSILGNVYQVWPAQDEQSEWVNDFSPSAGPMDSCIIFGGERIPDMPVFYPDEEGLRPYTTLETITAGGTQGLGTLNNYNSDPDMDSGLGNDTMVEIPGDANLDGMLDLRDVSIAAFNLGMMNATWMMGDFNDNNVVGPEDLKILAGNWGVDAEIGDAYFEYRDYNSGPPTFGTVDLMQLVIPVGQSVTVELELATYDGNNSSTVYSFSGGNALTVPEPSTLALLGFVGLGLALARRWKA